MITVAQVSKDILLHDDIALAAAKQGWLNLSAYARAIRPAIQQSLMKDVQEGTLVTALARVVGGLQPQAATVNFVQSLAVHANLEGITYERTAELSAALREMYGQIKVDDQSYVTVTQGINEVTIIAESSVASLFRRRLAKARKIYDKQHLVGITVKLRVGYLETPNLIHSLTRRLAYRSVNIIEIVSTATELTFIIEKHELPTALQQLQQDI